MAQASDLFIGAEADARAIAEAADPFAGRDGFRVKHVGDLEWLAFGRALRTDVFEEPAFLDKALGRSVQAMTEHVRDRLAAMEDGEQKTLLSKWRSHTETLAALEEAAVAFAVTELCKLAGRAKAADRAILYLASW